MPSCTPPTAWVPPALPFTVRPLHGSDELAEVVKLRHAAYARRSCYQPAFAASLALPDERDSSGTAYVLVARDKANNELLGTLRATPSFWADALLPAQTPHSELTQDAFLLIDRFAVRPGRPSVSPALLKAAWLTAQRLGCPALVALAKKTLVGHYGRWGAMELLAGESPVVVPEHLTEPVYLMGVRTEDVLAKMACTNPRYRDFLQSKHSDICLNGIPLAVDGLGPENCY